MKTVMSIVLILVGIVGIYFVSRGSTEPAPVIQQVAAPEQRREEVITIAVAKRDLANKTILTNDDFETKTLTIAENAAEKNQFSLHSVGNELINWAVKSPIQAGSTIPVSLLVKPGTTEYITMFLQPGSVIYTFTIPPSDYYIFDNLKVGDSVDIYLPFDRNPASGDVVSPGTRPNITDVRLKPIMVDKKVLAIFPSLDANKTKQTNVNQTVVDGHDSVVVELTDHDLKVLKALEGKAKFVIFPSIPESVIQERELAKKTRGELETNNPNQALSNKESDNWPISNEEIFVATPPIKRVEG